MNVAFSIKDPNTFASACLDRTVKMWSLGSGTPNFTLEAHEKGVNYVEFYPGADRPYLVTTGDDKTVKVWDYLSKSCVQTMHGHTNNVSFAHFHPNLPIIISGSEDGTVKIWNSGTYRLETTLSYSLERAWCIALRRDANEVAVGFDEGVVVIKVFAAPLASHNPNLTLAASSSAATNPPSAWTPLASSSTRGTTKSSLGTSKPSPMISKPSPTDPESLLPQKKSGPPKSSRHPSSTPPMGVS
jgi:WD40 repeat protein